MTLIACMANPGFAAVSDVLISRRPGEPVQVALPLASRDMTFGYPSHQVVGTAQKTVLINPARAILWSGTQITADHIIRQIASSNEASGERPLSELLLELNLHDHELSSVSLIDCRVNSTNAINLQSHNVTQRAAGITTVLAAGTGAWDFFDGTEDEPGSIEPDRRNAFYHSVLSRLARALVDEADSASTLAFGYGGWFELVLMKEAVFAKIPYLLKFWRWDNGAIIDLPAFQSWYDEEILHILSVDLRRPEPERLFLSKIGNSLHEVSGQRHDRDWEPKQSPEFQFHALLVGDRWYLWISGGLHDFSITIRDGVVWYDFTPTFLNTMERLANGTGSQLKLVRPGTEP